MLNGSLEAKTFCHSVVLIVRGSFGKFFVHSRKNVFITDMLIIYCSGLHGLPQEHDCSELESANRKVALCQKCNNMIMVPDTENWTLEEAVCISVHCINANAGSNPNMIYEA